MHSIVWGLLLAAIPLPVLSQATHRYTVLIHEIFADPTPSAGLANAEYLELRNTGSTPVNLKGWLLADSSGAMKLPEYWLQPDSLVVVTSRPVYPNGISGTGFPSLANDGETITLYNPEGAVEHAVRYEPAWFGGSIKGNGGWSLEMRDARWPCAGAENWRPSVAPFGGTPGAPNSVTGLIDSPAPPEVIRISVRDSLHIVLHFSATVDSAAAALPAGYSLPHIGAVTVPPPLFRTAEVALVQPLEKGRVYSLSAAGLADCSGRPAGTTPAITFALPEAPAPGDIVLNEVLFDPPPNTADFVEIYNRSGKVLELYPLHLATRGADGALKQPVPLTEGPRLLLPGAYLAFTEDADALCRYYACKGELMPLPALPTLPDDEGRVLLLHPNGKMIDSFHYHRSLHISTLLSPRGVSLERIDPGGQLWHSAATAAGGATPGYANSQLLSAREGEAGMFSVFPQAFSPNNDGHEDVATISWRLPEPGYTASIWVLDALGREIRLLAGNLLLGNGGKVFWDGQTAQKTPAPPGIYVIFIRIFNLSGSVKTWKSALVLAEG